MHNEQAAQVECALQRLPATYRKVIELRNRDGFAFDEIGTVLDRSANAARKLWSRAIERLQRELELSDVPRQPDRPDSREGR